MDLVTREGEERRSSGLIVKYQEGQEPKRQEPCLLSQGQEKQRSESGRAREEL